MRKKPDKGNILAVVILIIVILLAIILGGCTHYVMPSRRTVIPPDDKLEKLNGGELYAPSHIYHNLYKGNEPSIEKQ